MGLFSNKKKPCPVCGNATPRLFPDTVEGLPVCKECAKKRDMPDSLWEGMTVEAFRGYIAFYHENQPMRDRFEETCEWGDTIYLDVPKKLFRLKPNGLVMDASCIKSFRLLEGDNVLFESSSEGLKCYETDVPARAQAAGPAISQFNIQYEQYRQMQRMQESMKRDGDKQDLPYINEPTFSYPVILKGLGLELTLEHPYWGGTYCWYGPHPTFDDTYPRIDDFLRSFEKELKRMHELAVHLMGFLGLNATDIPASTQNTPDARAMPAAPADPIEEIQRYKALLDSGILTEEEFTAKKRQLLGI